jgi:hypothetical protein
LSTPFLKPDDLRKGALLSGGMYVLCFVRTHIWVLFWIAISSGHTPPTPTLSSPITVLSKEVHNSNFIVQNSETDLHKYILTKRVEEFVIVICYWFSIFFGFRNSVILLKIASKRMVQFVWRSDLRSQHLLFQQGHVLWLVILHSQKVSSVQPLFIHCK